MKATSVLLWFAFFLPALTFAAPQGGFTSGAIWASKEIITAGESLKISSSLYNSYDDKLSGTVVFNDGDVAVGSVSFSLPPGEGSIVSISVRPEAGEHSYFAEITEAALQKSGGTETLTDIIGSKTAAINRTVRPKPTVEKEQAASAISTTQGAQEKINDFSPTVGNVINPLLDRIDSFRANAAAYTEEGMSSARARVAEATSTETVKDGKILGVETPSFIENIVESKGVRSGWDYFLLYLNAIANAILKSAVLFYPIAVLLLFFAARMLYRRITGRYY